MTNMIRSERLHILFVWLAISIIATIAYAKNGNTAYLLEHKVGPGDHSGVIDGWPPAPAGKKTIITMSIRSKTTGVFAWAMVHPGKHVELTWTPVTTFSTPANFTGKIEENTPSGKYAPTFEGEFKSGGGVGGGVTDLTWDFAVKDSFIIKVELKLQSSVQTTDGRHVIPLNITNVPKWIRASIDVTPDIDKPIKLKLLGGHTLFYPWMVEEISIKEDKSVAIVGMSPGDFTVQVLYEDMVCDSDDGVVLKYFVISMPWTPLSQAEDKYLVAYPKRTNGELGYVEYGAGGTGNQGKAEVRSAITYTPFYYTVPFSIRTNKKVRASFSVPCETWGRYSIASWWPFNPSYIAFSNPIVSKRAKARFYIPRHMEWRETKDVKHTLLLIPEWSGETILKFKGRLKGRLVGAMVTGSGIDSLKRVTTDENIYLK